MSQVEIEQSQINFRSLAREVSVGEEADVADELLDYIGEKIETFERQSGSGWAMKRIIGMEVINYAVRKERGSSYIPTPARYTNSRCGLMNIRNDDEQCFKWCMLYHQSDQKKNGEILSVLKKVEDKYNWDNVKFPCTFKDIATFENNNKSPSLYMH